MVRCPEKQCKGAARETTVERGGPADWGLKEYKERGPSFVGLVRVQEIFVLLWVL
jgi:hypothetical protein